MDICKKDEILKTCGCTYPACSKKGKCCECIAYHRKRNELPGCLFPEEAEKTYNRSIKYFCNIMEQRDYKLT
jgi:hypothetical protein